MPIVFACPECGKQVKSADDSAGKQSHCPICKELVTIPSESIGTKAEPKEPVPGPIRVIVVDFQMPFESMIVLMVKWALASIPAAIILGFVFGLVLLLIAAMSGHWRG